MKSAKMIVLLSFAPLFAMALGFSSCGKSASSAASAVEDTSASGAVAGAVGAALSSTNPSGTTPADAFQLIRGKKARSSLYAFLEYFGDSFGDSFLNFLPDALASTACPSVNTTAGAGCTSATSTSVLLNLSACSRGSSGKTSLTGTFDFQVGGSWTVACGTGINDGGSGGATIGGEFTNAAGSAGATASYTTSFGTLITADDSSANLSNYNGDTLTPISGQVTPGDGFQVTFSSGARSAIAVNTRLTSPIFDHSITTSGSPLTITESAGGTHRTVDGSIYVYHNILKVKGTTTFTTVGFQDTCCTPVSGTVTTKFSATTLSGVAGRAIDGLSETLSFTGCGTATLTGTSGSTANVTLDTCI